MFVSYVLFACLCVCAQAQSVPVVSTSQGKVIGVYENNYTAFYGIPYGGPTSKQNRFKDPIPAPAFTEDFNATNKFIKCAQLTTDAVIGVEDCLVLNIYTKNYTSPKPVIVVIESENYETTRPELYNISYNNLINKDIVVVHVNHRLSIFGFLCLHVPEAPGNAGLKDIVLGLNWIKRNIYSFGGDPYNIVLLGQGSGAALVDILTLSPATKELINKAVVLSGSALAPWAVTYHNIRNAYYVGTMLGYASNISKSDLANAFTNSKYDELSKILPDLAKNNKEPLFAPCINDYLKDDPINILKSKNYNHIPYLAGYTNKEGTVKIKDIVNDSWMESLHKNISALLPENIAFESESSKLNVIKQIHNLYFPIDQRNLELVNDTLNYFGDVLQVLPILRSVRARGVVTGDNIYLFEFQYKAMNDDDWPYPEIPLNEAKHGDILCFILSVNVKPAHPSIKEKFIKRIVTFAYFGLVNIPDHTAWRPVTKDNFAYLFVDGMPERYYGERHDRNPYSKQMKFWDDIYSKYYKPLNCSGCNYLRCIILFFCTFFVILM